MVCCIQLVPSSGHLMLGFKLIDSFLKLFDWLVLGIQIRHSAALKALSKQEINK